MTQQTRRGATIRIFLADGVPDGLWVVEKSNWTGLALMCPRASYQAARTREVFARPGVYVLVGPSETTGDRARVYIGEADVLSKRLDQHFARKDFWSRAVVFTSRDEHLNKAHVRYLEARLVRLAVDAQRAEVDNGNAPNPPFLSEAEQAEMDAFLDEMLTIYPVMDVRAFEQVEPPAQDATRLTVSGPDADAQGVETADGFVVFSGSYARATEVPSIHAYMSNLRAQLVTTGVLVEDGPRLRFARDYEFNSPSTAAGVVLGRAANGRTEWKASDGRSLREIQAEAIRP